MLRIMRFQLLHRKFNSRFQDIWNMKLQSTYFLKMFYREEKICRMAQAWEIHLGVWILYFHKLYLLAESLQFLLIMRGEWQAFRKKIRLWTVISYKKMVKNKYRNWIDDEELESCLRVATSHLPPDIETLVGKRQRQASDGSSSINKNKNVS
jgi:hypothetical protein